jgi:hypothetical protein
MFKNIIIVVLLVVLIITLYSYTCVTNNMLDYQIIRMQYIEAKENEIELRMNELKNREDNLVE